MKLSILAPFQVRNHLFPLCAPVQCDLSLSKHKPVIFCYSQKSSFRVIMIKPRYFLKKFQPAFAEFLLQCFIYFFFRFYSFLAVSFSKLGFQPNFFSLFLFLGQQKKRKKRSEFAMVSDAPDILNVPFTRFIMCHLVKRVFSDFTTLHKRR